MYLFHKKTKVLRVLALLCEMCIRDRGILGHIQEEILYLQTCEPDEKDFRIGVAFGYCREAVNAYITTSYGASWKEHDLQQMVSEFEGYLENLQSDETQWKNAKNGDLDRLYDAWSEVLTQIDKGKNCLLYTSRCV